MCARLPPSLFPAGGTSCFVVDGRGERIEGMFLSFVAIPPLSYCVETVIQTDRQTDLATGVLPPFGRWLLMDKCDVTMVINCE